MPKYIPTYDDLYETKPCFICGGDVIDENTDTCCDLCEQQKIMFEDDYEWFLMNEFMNSEEVWDETNGG